MKLSAVVLALPVAMAHMGISSPIGWHDPQARNPNPGAMCHGKGPGGEKLKGTVTLKMSGGASHNGGPCAVFWCAEMPASIGECTRDVVNPVPGCEIVVETRDCSVKGAMDPFEADRATGMYIWYWNPGFNSGTCEIYQNCFSAGGDGVVVAPTGPPVVDTTPITGGGTPSKIRCGTSWGEANGKCGNECTSNTDCLDAVSGVQGQCFSDLDDCVNGAVQDTTFIVGPATGTSCVSKKPHVTDAFCRKVGCSPVYTATGYCSTTGASMQATGLTAFCEPYPVKEGETWEDIARSRDVRTAALQASNPKAYVAGQLIAGTILYLPGSCDVAIEQAEAMSGASSLSLGAAIAAPLAFSLFF